jgi:hypothetical protein
MADKITVINRTENTLGIWIAPGATVSGGIISFLNPGVSSGIAVSGTSPSFTVAWYNSTHIGTANPGSTISSMVGEIMPNVTGVVPNSIVTITSQVGTRPASGAAGGGTGTAGA